MSRWLSSRRAHDTVESGPRGQHKIINELSTLMSPSLPPFLRTFNINDVPVVGKLLGRMHTTTAPVAKPRKGHKMPAPARRRSGTLRSRSREQGGLPVPPPTSRREFSLGGSPARRWPQRSFLHSLWRPARKARRRCSTAAGDRGGPARARCGAAQAAQHGNAIKQWDRATQSAADAESQMIALMSSEVGAAEALGIAKFRAEMGNQNKEK